MAVTKTKAKTDALQQSIDEMSEADREAQAKAEEERQAALAFISTALPKLAADESVDSKQLGTALKTLDWGFDQLKGHVEMYKGILNFEARLVDRDDTANGDAIRAAEAQIEALKSEIAERQNKRRQWSGMSQGVSQAQAKLKRAGLFGGL